MVRLLLGASAPVLAAAAVVELARTCEIHSGFVEYESCRGQLYAAADNLLSMIVVNVEKQVGLTLGLGITALLIPERQNCVVSCVNVLNHDHYHDRCIEPTQTQVSSAFLVQMGRLTGRLFVGFTTCLISFIAYSSQIFVIWPWYGRALSIQLLSLLIPFKYACFL